MIIQHVAEYIKDVKEEIAYKMKFRVKAIISYLLNPLIISQ